MRRRSKGWLAAAWAASALVAGLAAGAPVGTAEVKYPEGYREWAHVKSMINQKGHPLFNSFGGIHHVYANKPALKALQAGKGYPDGAGFVFDLLDVKVERNAVLEGPRKLVGVMLKDAKKFAATGGWGFEGFKGDTRERLVTDGGAACFACHKTQQASGFVYAKFRP